MATYVKQILAEMKSIASSTLGATYQELRYVYDVEKNSLRDGRLAYGIRPLGSDTADGVVKAYTMDHTFEFILTDTFARTDSDAQREDALEVIYDKLDQIFTAIANTKLNLASFVLNVFNPSVSEPEFFDDMKFVVLRMQFIVRYRTNL